jgi:catechol 2,3-dioxygenase-like lactoylglutathione lyase family enzyme/predicted enzyme related to lactoylglutathione lyase
MISTLDHLIIVVKDLAEAEKDYTKIFGMSPVWRGEHKELGTINSIFNLENTYFELLASKGAGLGADLVNSALEQDGEGLTGIAFGTDNLKDAHASIKSAGYGIGEISNGEGSNSDNVNIRRWQNLFLPPELTRGLFSFVIEHTDGELPSSNYQTSSISKLDHVVINTNDADGLISVYQDVFKIRLALDKVIEHWKKRMLFFRLNKTTIEVIESKDDQPASDQLWGLAWEVKNIEDTYQRLIEEGVDVTPVQKGIKENTFVATIKSHTHDVPTLLIEHVK